MMLPCFLRSESVPNIADCQLPAVVAEDTEAAVSVEPVERAAAVDALAAAAVDPVVSAVDKVPVELLEAAYQKKQRYMHAHRIIT